MSEKRKINANIELLTDGEYCDYDCPQFVDCVDSNHYAECRFARAIGADENEINNFNDIHRFKRCPACLAADKNTRAPAPLRVVWTPLTAEVRPKEGDKVLVKTDEGIMFLGKWEHVFGGKYGARGESVTVFERDITHFCRIEVEEEK